MINSLLCRFRYERLSTRALSLRYS
jgi:hypothetical protein